MTIFSSELLGWNFLSSRFFIGIYYGILATLPLAPSQLLSIRVLLLEDENKQAKFAGSGAAKGIFIAGVSGFLIAQFAMFLSIYCFPLYQLWFKPHVFNLLLPPFLLWHYFKIIEFDPVVHLIPNYKYPLFDSRVRTAFIESFVLQIINPIVLPNPVFTRLMSIFLFRYSNIPIFVFGSLIGWFSGQLLFVKLSSMLLSRLQLDSPTIYRIVKRIVHWAFPPIIMGIFLSYIGRVSMVPFDQKFDTQKILSYHLWPDICYNRNKISRLTHFMLSSHQSKIRNQTNAPFNTLNVTLHKNHFSQYFFQTCVSDGKKRLSHNYPISISLIQNDLNHFVKLSENQNMLTKDWFKDKEIRLLRFNCIMKSKCHRLDRIIDVVEQRVIRNALLYKFHQMMNTRLKKLDIQMISIFDKRQFFSIHYHGLELRNLLESVIKEIRLKNLNIKMNIIFDKRLASINYHGLVRKEKRTSSNEFSKSIREYIQSNALKEKRIKKNYDIRFKNTLLKQSIFTKDQSPWLTDLEEDNDIYSKTNRNYVTRWQINDKRLNRLKQMISKLNINNVYFDLYKVLPVWKSRSKFSSFYNEFDIFKKNVKRRKRKKFFMRSLTPGATFGRSRNTAGMFFQFLQTKPRSSFFLRAKEIIINSKENLNSQQRVSQTKAEIFDFSTSHSVRGPALITQAFIRKYIKLPIFILGKSLVRLVLMHTSEWNQDWTEWSQEKYVYCYYNGNHVLGNKMPPHWLGDGLQIQILSPFYLTPWRPSLYKKYTLLETKNPLFLKSSYINIWGQETDIPFGEIQHTPFVKPLVKGFIIFSQYQLRRIFRIMNQIWLTFHKQYSFIQSQFYKKIRTFDKQTSQNTVDFKKNDIRSSLERQNISDKSSDLPHKFNNQNNNLFSIETDVKKHPISKDKIYIPKLKESNTKIQINQEIENSNSVSLTQNITSNSRLIGVNNDEFIYKDHYSLIKQSIRYNQLSIFPNTFIFKQTKKFFEYQILKIRIVFLRLYQILIYTRKSIFRKIMNFIRVFQITMFQHKRNIIFLLKKIISKINNNFIIILNNKTLLPKKLNNYEDSLSDSFHYVKEKTYLSSAYILHKIWQQNFPNRVPIQEFCMNWEANNILTLDMENVLCEHGLFHDDFEETYLYSFGQWLKPFRRYTPSPEIWNQIFPNTWEQIFVNNLYTDKSSQYLSYFKPLFEKSNKMTKRWQANLLINSYTNSLKNNQFNNVLTGWKTKDREIQQDFHRNLICNNFDKKSNAVTSKSVTWGLTNTRNNPLVVSFPLIQSFNKSLIYEPSNFIYNQEPIYTIYKTTSDEQEENQIPTFYPQKKNRFSNFKQRVSFRPIIQYKWKFEQDRFKALDNINTISKVKSDLNNAIKNAMLAKKNKVKSLSTFEEKVKETSLQWKTLNLAPLNCETIRKRQAKIVDDEMFMHTIVNSFSKFKNQYWSTKNFVSMKSPVQKFFLTKFYMPRYSILIPEDLLLAKSLREYRILSSFEFISQQQLYKLNKMNFVSQFEQIEAPNYIGVNPALNPSFLQAYQELSSLQTIKRYLWPSYRVEDLACMNRYWINTANQARFSNLRIRIYPNLNR